MSTPDGLWGTGRGGILRVSLGAISLVAVGALAVAFTDTVDLWVTAPAKIDGTIRPADERETYLLALPRDAKLTATVKRKGKGDLVPFLDVLHPDMSTVEAGVTSGKSTVLKGYVLPASGEYRVRVSGDDTNDGDYRAKIKIKPRTAWGTDDGGSVEPAATAEFPFAAPRKAAFKITLTAAKDSAFVPEIVEVRAPDASTVPVDPPDPGATKHKVKDVRTDQNGEHVVVVRNAGGTAGSFKIDVKLTLGKVTKAVVDLRDGEGDELSEESAVYGRAVDEDGGLVAPTDGDTEISDAAVDVPPGALNEPIVITISADENFYVSDEENEGGVAVEFGPEGATFENAVTITIPFNPQAFDDPETELEIAVLNTETGEVEILPGPYDIDLVAGTVTVQAPHFSVYQSVSRRPRPVKGTFVELELTTDLRPGIGASFTVGLHPVGARFGPRSGNGVEFTENTRGLQWRAGVTGPVLDVIDSSGATPELGTVQIGSNTGVVLNLLSGPRVYRRGRSSNVVVGSDLAGVRVLLRVAKRRPTRLTLAGTWHAFVLEQGADTLPNGQLLLQSLGTALTLDVAFDGTVGARAAASIERTAEFPRGSWRIRGFSKHAKTGRLVPNGPTALLDMRLGPDQQLSEVALLPTLRGDLLVGRAFRTEGPPGAETAATVRLVLLVRASRDAATADVTGFAQVASLAAAAVDRTIATQDVPVLRIDSRVSDVGLSPNGLATVLFGQESVTRFDAAGLIPAPTRTDVDGVTKYRIRPDGRFDEGGTGVRGAVTRRREALVGLQLDGDRVGVVIGLPGPQPDQ